jgi:hypothetical protein
MICRADPERPLPANEPGPPDKRTPPTGRGVVDRPGAAAKLAYGEMDGRSTTRIQALDAFITGAGFDARLSSVIEREMWEKWRCSLRSGPYAGQHPGGRGASGGRQFVLGVIDETVAIISAVGAPPNRAAVDVAVRASLRSEARPTPRRCIATFRKGTASRLTRLSATWCGAGAEPG